MGAPDPRPSRTRRPARHATGHGAAARVHDRPFGGGEEGLRRRQVLRSGDEGGARAAARDAARLRAEHRVAHPLGIIVVLAVVTNWSKAGWSEFTDQKAAQWFVDQLLAAVDRFGLDGIDIDDEYS